MAELADARDSKSRSVRSVGSTPTAGSFYLYRFHCISSRCGSNDFKVGPSHVGVFRNTASLGIAVAMVGHHEKLKPVATIAATGFCSPQNDVQSIRDRANDNHFFLFFLKMIFALPGIETTKAFKS